MAFSLRNPRQVAKKGNPALPKAKMPGVTPPQKGHPVRGKGTKSSKGGMSRGSKKVPAKSYRTLKQGKAY